VLGHLHDALAHAEPVERAEREGLEYQHVKSALEKFGVLLGHGNLLENLGAV
jgi:hypothetical protein